MAASRCGRVVRKARAAAPYSERYHVAARLSGNDKLYSEARGATCPWRFDRTMAVRANPDQGPYSANVTGQAGPDRALRQIPCFFLLLLYRLAGRAVLSFVISPFFIMSAHMCVFDCLALDGDDMRDLPLSGAQGRTRAAGRGNPEPASHNASGNGGRNRIRGGGDACLRGLLVAKQADSPYRAGRQPTCSRSRMQTTIARKCSGFGCSY